MWNERINTTERIRVEKENKEENKSFKYNKEYWEQ
jgi:hypothetical protein